MMTRLRTCVTEKAHRISWIFSALLVLVLYVQSTRGEKISAKRFYAASLVNIEIELPTESWDALCRQSRDFATALSDPSVKPYTYFKANIVVDGVKIDSVGIRKKGFIGSLDTQRPSLKIKFDEFIKQDPFKGLDRLTLNNNKQDTAQVSQYLTYKLFNAAGIHAPRCNLARVKVNGEELGIYSNVEAIRRPFLKDRYGKNNGILYEGTLADFYPKSIDRFEAKTKKKENDREKARRLAQLLSQEGDLDLNEMEQFVDIDYFLKFWAIESLVGFWDGYSGNQNNFFVYENPDDDRLYFMPWGADSSFMGTRGPFGRFGGSGPTSMYSQGIIANRLYHSPSIPDRYKKTMLNILETVWKEDELEEEVDRIEQLVAAHLHERQFNAPQSMDRVKNFIRSRREQVVGELDSWPAKIASEPRKPMYTVRIGSATGRFATKWTEQGDQSTPSSDSEAHIQLRLDGDEIVLKEPSANARPGSTFGGFSFRRAQQRAPIAPSTIVLSGIRPSDDKKVTLTFSLSRETFEASAGRTIPIRGSLVEGQSSFGFGAFGGGSKMLQGELKLVKAGTSDDSPVEGEFDVTVLENRGGLFDRRRQTASGGGNRLAIRLMGFDKDKDGKVTKEELSKLFHRMLERGDTNGDKALDKSEIEKLTNSSLPKDPKSND